MGAKTNISQVPTMNPQQLALLNSYIRGVTNQMQGMTLGQEWGGPGTLSREGLGGTPWNTDVAAVGGSNPYTPYLGPNLPVPSGGLRASTQSAQGMAPIASSAGFPATSTPGLGSAPNPFGMAAYSNRNQLVSPIVNPFRRNLGG